MENGGNKAIVWGIVGLVIVIILIALAPFTVVGAGQEAVVTRLGEVNRTISPGFHFVLPLVEGVHKYDVQIQKYEAKALAYSQDIQTVDSTVALNYHFQREAVSSLYKDIGEADSAVARVIDPAIQESVKATTAKFTAQELIERRSEVKDDIRTALTERLKSRYVVVDDLSIVNFDFSNAYEAAIEAKQVAQQNALAAKNKLEQVKYEADQRVAQATAEAEAIKIQAQAITQQGGAEYVNLKAVEKWNGVLPVQMIPGSSVPFINLNK